MIQNKNAVHKHHKTSDTPTPPSLALVQINNELLAGGLG